MDGDARRFDNLFLRRWQRAYYLFVLSALFVIWFSSSCAQAQEARGPNNQEATTRIKTLSLRVVTHRVRGSGTDNAVTLISVDVEGYSGTPIAKAGGKYTHDLLTVCLQFRPYGDRLAPRCMTLWRYLQEMCRGEVPRARDTKLGRDVPIKVLPVD